MAALGGVRADDLGGRRANFEMVLPAAPGKSSDSSGTPVARVVVRIVRTGWQKGGVSIGEELLEERRRRRRAGDPRFTDADREYARRRTTGDLVGEFQAALDAVSAADPLLGGDPDSDNDPSD